jgi:tripartite-type tricarboxylate transporter receptor subunit TctC
MHDMTPSNRRRLLQWLTLAAAGSGTASLHAQGAAYPTKPIRLVVGYPPGGSGDFITRVAADEIGKEIGVQVLVENRPGAGGTIANEAVSKAAADGYTVLNAGPFALTNALYRKLAYDGAKDFIPVTQLAVGPMIIVVNNDLPVRNLKELIAYAKANPDKLNVASSGNGSTPHLAGAQFEAVAGVRFTTIQFKGGGPAATSTIAGDTHVMFATPPTVINFIKAGRLRPLALTSAQSSPAIPGIPGALEAGLPDTSRRFRSGCMCPLVPRPRWCGVCTRPPSRRWRGPACGNGWRSRAWTWRPIRRPRPSRRHCATAPVVWSGPCVIRAPSSNRAGLGRRQLAKQCGAIPNVSRAPCRIKCVAICHCLWIRTRIGRPGSPLRSQCDSLMVRSC